MRHRNAGKQLSRNTSHRKALRRNMAASLFEHGAVRTTEVKAKELRPFVEHLITVARRGTLEARRQVIAEMQDRFMADKEHEGELLEKTVVQKLFDEIAPRYVDRPGGYTRIIRLSERRIGDAGNQVLLQLVEETKAEAGAARKAAREKEEEASEKGEEEGQTEEQAEGQEKKGQPEEGAEEEAGEEARAESPGEKPEESKKGKKDKTKE
jgi:large subunit ribosomal protein L17